MAAIAKMHREVYVPSPEEGVSAVVSTKYTGRGLWREEMLSYQRSSDWSDTHQMRTSEDGGRTWSEWKMFRKEWPMQGAFTKEQMPFARCTDPESGKLVQFLFQRILIGEGTEALKKIYSQEAPTYFDHNFYQISEDEGRTWGEPHQLRYEDGPPFDPDDWGNDDYLRTNRMYGGYGAVATREGPIVYSAAELPLEITDRGEKETVAAVRCFIGKWRKATNRVEWELSDPIYVPHRISGRGLQEPCMAQLSDGRLFLVMRGSNEVLKSDPWKGEVESPGRKWMSLSEDGGGTWTPVTDLRYDTGEPFYSPGTFAKMHRHSRTGKLYWFGNITPAPPDGGRPRYPLYIAEVEESIPAIKKETLTVIDDRDPNKDPELVQFSNFELFEHPETGQIELYMTRYGETPGNMWTANAYRYAITLV